ncbi:MAG: MBL fold metallo-hydrolase [Cyanobacteria bacterium P01_H01_bin.74]
MTSIPQALQPLIQFDWSPYTVRVFNLGCFALDGGAMYGVVPKTIWQKLSPPDDKNRIRLATNCVLIEYNPPDGQSAAVLIETGIGNKFNEKFTAIYAIEDDAPVTEKVIKKNTAEKNTEEREPRPLVLDLALASAGLTADDISYVVFTHLHFDHAGGATRKLPDGSIAPMFANARYTVQEGEWHYANCPHERCKASYLKENLAPVLAGNQQLNLLTAHETELLPGLTCKRTGGHTPYHQVVTLETEKNSLMFWGDLLPTRHHVRIPFVMGYDEYPVETMAKKKALLQETANPAWVHVFVHDTEIPVARLLPDVNGKPDEYSVTAAF